MLNTHLFLTQTYLNLEQIQKVIAYSFFVNNQLKYLSNINANTLDKNWQHYRSNNQIIVWDGQKADTESQKDAFKRFVQSEVYVQYSQSTILFLGDLNGYSETLQEGMLKLLEEPPINLIIVLFAQNISNIKPTILSRVQTHNLAIQDIFGNLNTELLEKVKKLPEPKTVVQRLLKNQKIELDKPNDKASAFERDELDFWLWQIQTNLGFCYLQKPELTIAIAIQKTIIARQLNDQNLQKKFAIGWLNT